MLCVNKTKLKKIIINNINNIDNLFFYVNNQNIIIDIIKFYSNIF